jgi:hypothetical protein
MERVEQLSRPIPVDFTAFLQKIDHSCEVVFERVVVTAWVRVNDE